MKNEITIQGKNVKYEIIHENENLTEIKIEDEVFQFSFLKSQGDKLIWGNESKIFPVAVTYSSDPNQKGLILENGGERYHLAPLDKKKALAKSVDSSEKGLHSPMPGKIFKILGQAGDQVQVGTPLLVLEAMKMEHTIKAPFAGVIESYPFKVGDQIPIGAKLVNLKKNE
jgi:biotin carboxyl carrier protein